MIFTTNSEENLYNDAYLSLISSKCKNINKKFFFMSIKACFSDFEKFKSNKKYSSTHEKWIDYMINKPLPSNYYCSILDLTLSSILFGKKHRRYKSSLKNLKSNISLSSEIRNDFDTFSSTDLGWISSIKVYFERLGVRGLKYKDIPRKIILKYNKGDYTEIDTFSVYNLRNIIKNKKKNTKILLLSDWGTGTPQAYSIVKKIFHYSKGGIDMVFHLGDVYYSGTYQEQKDYVTKIIRKVDKKVPLFNLAGNHDYYAGGDGYLKNLKKLNNFQKRSFLCIRGDKVQFICLDTSYFDSNPFKTFFKNGKVKINKNQEKWANRMIETAGNRKTIILSHHELFSHKNKQLKDGINKKLYKSFQKNLDKIDAWFWGHEHAFAIYKENFLGLKKGRLIGNGAMPFSSYKNPYKIDPDFTWGGEKINKKKLIKKVIYKRNEITWNTVGVLLNIKDNGEIIAKYLELPVTTDGKIKKLRKIYQEKI